jgi:membrane protease YdiL (CAAX protease family)
MIKQIFQFFLVKIVIGIVVLIGIVTLGQMGARELLLTTTFDPAIQKLMVGCVTALLSVLAYYFLFRYYEQRNITELSANGLAKNLAMGLLLGALLQSLTIWVIYIMGGFAITALNPISFLLPSFVMGFTTAIFEEILIRGILFRLLEEKLGSYIALICSAAIFGALHFTNPNSSVIAAVGIALQAGLFLAAAFMYTRNLWFPIAIHFAWNFTQAGIFGANVSGNKIGKSLFTTTISGDNWYTGGLFGPEGSVQATVFCLLATAYLMWLIQKQGKIIVPVWKRKQTL